MGTGACFVAGNAVNWDSQYLEETEIRHDEVNSCVDVLLDSGSSCTSGQSSRPRIPASVRSWGVSLPLCQIPAIYVM